MVSNLGCNGRFAVCVYHQGWSVSEKFSIFYYRNLPSSLSQVVNVAFAEMFFSVGNTLKLEELAKNIFGL